MTAPPPKAAIEAGAQKLYDQDECAKFDSDGGEWDDRVRLATVVLTAALASGEIVTREELEAARDTNARLNRRCQAAEAAVTENIEKVERAGMSLGRGLANAGYYSMKEEIAALQDKLNQAIEALRGRDGRDLVFRVSRRPRHSPPSQSRPRQTQGGQVNPKETTP